MTDQNQGSGNESMQMGSDDPPDGVVNDPHRNGTGPSPDGIPSQIANWMKTCLRQLGHSDEEIARMKPFQAHEILRAELRDRGYTDAEIREFTPAQKQAAIFGADPNEEEIFKP